MYTIYIDESGTLPDKKDEVIVVATVSTNSIQKINQIFKSLKKKGNSIKSEIKYYTSGDKTKKIFFEKLLKVVFDKHFSSKKDIDKFNNTIQKLFSEKPILTHVDSKIDQNVNISDMVAGAVLAHETGKNSIYFDMISEKIISNKELNWIEAKRKFINKKLA